MLTNILENTDLINSKFNRPNKSFTETLQINLFTLVMQFISTYNQQLSILNELIRSYELNLLF